MHLLWKDRSKKLVKFKLKLVVFYVSKKFKKCFSALLTYLEVKYLKIKHNFESSECFLSILKYEETFIFEKSQLHVNYYAQMWTNQERKRGRKSCRVHSDREKSFKTMKRGSLVQSYSRTISFIHLCHLLLCLRLKVFKYSNHRKIILRILLIRAGDVHPNPGPKDIITYNIRGLNEYKKLKRFLNTCANIIKSNPKTIIAIQETHLNNSSKIMHMWRYDFCMSPSYGAGGGCMILYDHIAAGTPVASSCDPNGRYCFLTLQLYNENTLYGNIYAPNNHDLNFFSNIDSEIQKITNDNNIQEIYLVGDFNLCRGDHDFINRKITTSESKANKYINTILTKYDLVDSYRHLHKNGGFTWKRGTTASRLDYIFIPKTQKNNLKHCELQAALDISDHMAVKVSLKDNEIDKGPGIRRLNIECLEDDNTLQLCKQLLDEQIKQIPTHWNPHIKWEFIKMSIRTTITQFACKQKSADKLHKEGLEAELNVLNKILENALINKNDSVISQTQKSIDSIYNELKPITDKISIKLAERAKCKWYDEGEKSNKYFLNIIKKRETAMYFETFIADTGETLTTTNDKLEHAKNYYQKLYSKNNKNADPDEYLKTLKHPKLTTKT